MRVATLILTAALAIGATGCSIVDRVQGGFTEGPTGIATKPYNATGGDVLGIAIIPCLSPLFIADLPISFAIDTALFPVDLVVPSFRFENRLYRPNDGSEPARDAEVREPARDNVEREPARDRG